MYPHRIDLVLRLETLEHDMHVLVSHLPVVFKVKSLEPPVKNAKEISHASGALSPETLMRKAPNAIKKALAYLEHDYACLGYELPKIWNGSSVKVTL